jgi:hypothetical protein
MGARQASAPPQHRQSESNYERSGADYANSGTPSSEAAGPRQGTRAGGGRLRSNYARLRRDQAGGGGSDYERSGTDYADSVGTPAGESERLRPITKRLRGRIGIPRGPRERAGLLFEGFQPLVMIQELFVVVRQLLVVVREPFGSIAIRALVLEKFVTMVDDMPEIDRAITEPPVPRILHPVRQRPRLPTAAIQGP